MKCFPIIYSTVAHGVSHCPVGGCTDQSTDGLHIGTKGSGALLVRLYKDNTKILGHLSKDVGLFLNHFETI